MQFLTSEISPNISMTHEGFLVCHNVPIARVGDQTYYDGEVPITADENGAVVINRSPEEVFSDSAIASFEGKPVTMFHPDSDVNPENWKDLSIGHTQNIRRGTGIEGDTLIGDMIIMDAEAIKAIKDRDIREVSCGYDAEYEEIAPGKGRQLNIRGNHVALVERGRCGSLCAIHDHKKEGEKSMKGFWKKIKDSLSPEEAKEVAAAIATSDSALTTDQKIDALTKTVSMLAKSMDSMMKVVKDAAEEEKKTEDEEEEEKKKKEMQDAKDQEEKYENGTMDEEEKEEYEKKMNKDGSKGIKDAAPILQEVLYRSSILAPDLSRPTMDAIKGMKKKTFDETCCLIKRRSLDAAYKTESGKAAITPFTKTEDFMTADCTTIDVAFIGASELMKVSPADRIKHSTSDFFRGGISVKDINSANAAFWSSRKGGI